MENKIYNSGIICTVADDFVYIWSDWIKSGLIPLVNPAKFGYVDGPECFDFYCGF